MIPRKIYIAAITLAAALLVMPSGKSYAQEGATCQNGECEPAATSQPAAAGSAGSTAYAESAGHGSHGSTGNRYLGWRIRRGIDRRQARRQERPRLNQWRANRRARWNRHAAASAGSTANAASAGSTAYATPHAMQNIEVAESDVVEQQNNPDRNRRGRGYYASKAQAAAVRESGSGGNVAKLG